MADGIKMAFRSCFVLVLLLLWSDLSFGQSPLPAMRGPGQGFEVAGTYTHVFTDGTFGSPLGTNGWTASASGAVLPMVQLSGEVGDYWRKELSLKSFLAGPQVKFRVWRLQPFIRELIGLSRVNGSNEFTSASGGGLDLVLTSRINVRILQCDYYRFFGGTYSKTDFNRTGVGIVFTFAR